MTDRYAMRLYQEKRLPKPWTLCTRRRYVRRAGGGRKTWGGGDAIGCVVAWRRPARRRRRGSSAAARCWRRCRAIRRGWRCSTAPTRQPDGRHLGALEVRPTSSGAPTVPLDVRSDGRHVQRAARRCGTSAASVANEPSTKATPPSSRTSTAGSSCGRRRWARRRRSAANVRDFDRRAGGQRPASSWTGTAQTIDAGNDGHARRGVGRRRARRALQCRMTLADGVAAAQASWRLSNDGRIAIATVRGATAMPTPGDVLLVTLASGRAADACRRRGRRALADDDGRTATRSRGSKAINELQVHAAVGRRRPR